MRVAAAAAMTAIALAGCGGGGESPPKHQPEQGGGEEAEHVEAVKGVDKRDLTAFYQVALAAGQLRQWGASRGKVGRSNLKEARRRLRHVRPADPTLVRARRQAAAAVDKALGGGKPRTALARSDRLRALIDRVVRSDPRFSALMPD
jgi:hypothetical protein